ncbi:MAG TPA: ubiquinol-cytochrome C chaperone family protein [Xanthobacteraceae bacterium]|nr:ubiquinol-cytochrome C chaperone family protein [Xanthobacteraceae bacterium]
MTIWPFKSFDRSRPGSGNTIGTIYGVIVARAREPAFYVDYGVPDTVDGRFDLVVLHLWMVVRQLAASADPQKLGQELFDHFCSDMDANLREMGVGDISVPKRMQAFGEAFYGRAAAYDAALAAGHATLAQALCKNVFNGRDLVQAQRLATYVEASVAQLAAADATALARGNWQFAALRAQ